MPESWGDCTAQPCALPCMSIMGSWGELTRRGRIATYPGEPRSRTLHLLRDRLRLLHFAAWPNPERPELAQPSLCLGLDRAMTFATPRTCRRCCQRIVSITVNVYLLDLSQPVDHGDDHQGDSEPHVLILGLHPGQEMLEQFAHETGRCGVLLHAFFGVYTQLLSRDP